MARDKKTERIVIHCTPSFKKMYQKFLEEKRDSASESSYAKAALTERMIKDGANE